MRICEKKFNEAIDVIGNVIDNIKKTKIKKVKKSSSSFLDEFPALTKFIYEANELSSTKENHIEIRFYNIANKLINKVIIR